MRLSARKSEVEAIVRLLEDDGFDSAEKMARAIVTTTFKLLLERDWYVVAQRNGGVNLIYGPLPTANEAVKHIGPLGLGGEVGVFKVRSVTKRKWDVVELDDALGTPDCECGHPDYVHVKGCSLKRCKCKGYKAKAD